jgi:tripartite-type tricarboxylate transporter receptor subunit TctC
MTAKLACRFLLFVAMVTAGAASAQTFPSKPISLIVAYPAGSSTDVFARDLAKAMASVLGENVIVVNKAGAGGVVGTDFVAKAAPDGYTVGWGTSSQLVMNVGVHKSLPFDVDKNLAQVGLIVKLPLVIIASSRTPATLKEFVAAAKADPKKFRYGSAGNGSVAHVMSEMFLKEAGIEVLHVPYRGAAPALADLAGGHVDFVIDTFIASGPFVEQGRARWLGVGGSRRSPSRPNVPTFAEQGYPGFDAYSWGSLFAPAKVPAAVMGRLNAALNAALQTTAFKARVEQVGGELLGPSTPQATEQFAARERAKWVPFIRGAGIVVE